MSVRMLSSRVLLEDAEGVAEDMPRFVHRREHRAGVVRQQGQELFVGVFPPARFKEVGAAVVMDHVDLVQELIDSFDVRRCCSSDFHLKPHPF